MWFGSQQSGQLPKSMQLPYHQVLLWWRVIRHHRCIQELFAGRVDSRL